MAVLAPLFDRGRHQVELESVLGHHDLLPCPARGDHTEPPVQVLEPLHVLVVLGGQDLPQLVQMGEDRLLEGRLKRGLK